ncbi:MAG: S9 family peptidase [Candidatus Micrarchaeota archaeon]|nr:S9 family peptidase [Candidatus Micrarchaeota archaeon]
MFFGVTLDFPKTKIVKFHETLHGVRITDNYRWLEADNTKEIKAWIKRQNLFSAKFIGKTSAKKDLSRKFRGLFNVEGFSLIQQRRQRDGAWRYFQNRRHPKQDFSVLYYRDGKAGKAKVAFNPNTLLKKGLEQLYWAIPSPDGTLLAYAVSQKGGDRASIKIKEIGSSKFLPDAIPPLRYVGLSWLNDSSGFYYTKWLEDVPEDRSRDSSVYFHKLGTSYTNDVPIFGKKLESMKFVSTKISSDDKYLIINVEFGWASNEIYCKPIGNSKPARKIISGINANFTPLQIINDQLYVLTNYKAINGRIIKVDLASPSEQNWVEIIPENSNVIEAAALLKSKIVLVYLENVSSVVSLYSLLGKHEYRLPLPPRGTASLNTNFESDDLSLMFSSFLIPSTLYNYNLSSRKLSLIEQSKQKFKSGAFESKQVRYKSEDGTRIPMFITHRKGMKLNGKNPCVIEGYGGFASGMLPYFNILIIPFLEKGGIYAIPSLRGGSEYGKKWHDLGKGKNKQNTFDDMINAAKWLISKKYTSPSKLGIMGASNGGLLVAACMIQHPELFKAVICGVPLTDMLRFHKFGGGKLWVDEYGNPNTREEFARLRKYSPYQNVKTNYNYPSTLITTSDNDTRTGPMHAFKFAAILQASKKQQNPILLRVEKNAGHNSSTIPLKNRIDSYSTKWAFLFDQLGVK